MSTDEHRGPGKRPLWWPWVRDQMIERWGRENIARLAREGGFNRSIVYGWQKGADVEPAIVGAVAKALGANPIEAYIAADYFTREQFDEFRTNGAERGVSNAALAGEVLRRMNTDGQHDAPGRSTGGGADVTALPPNRGVDVVDTERRDRNRSS